MASKLSASQIGELLSILEPRFNKNKSRHAKIDWAEVAKRIKADPAKAWSLNEMEMSGGEPDVIGTDKSSGAIIFADCAAESPAGRRSLCYDDEALNARKENKPAGSAVGMAEEMGIRLMNEAEYRHLQTLGKFDLKTSSWVETPEAIRKLKGAVFCDRRYDHVFYYHNGAESYYAARGFRGIVYI